MLRGLSPPVTPVTMVITYLPSWPNTQVHMPIPKGSVVSATHAVYSSVACGKQVETGQSK